MTNQEFVRRAYAIAEVKDIPLRPVKRRWPGVVEIVLTDRLVEE
jgi:hypothetical protein